MTAFDRSASMGFALNPLNRLSEHRHDDAFVVARRTDPSAQFLLFDEQAMLLVTPAPTSPAEGDVGATALASRHVGVRFTAARLATLGLNALAGDSTQAIYMGEDAAGVSLFALSLDQETAERLKTQAAGGLQNVDLRTIASAGLVAADMLGILGGAKSVVHWHRSHGFCARCGCRSLAVGGGWRRDCPACGAQHFPRVDPVVIMLAVDGERCLLGRQPRFAPGMYSALAGFLEPGETMEDAVRREIHEEAGIVCAEVGYFASQPWPFPSSLMLACFARARTTNIIIDATELEDARWFSRDEVAKMLDGSHPTGLSAPQPFAIAHHLLRAFVQEKWLD